MKEQSKILMKAVANYPGLTFTEANVMAYLERFADTNIDEFTKGLELAMQESPQFFPTAISIEECVTRIKVMRIKREMNDERANNLNQHKKQNQEATKKPEGWLLNLFKEKRAEYLRKKTYES